jgi:hypothetical protein
VEAVAYGVRDSSGVGEGTKSAWLKNKTSLLRENKGVEYGMAECVECMPMLQFCA